MWSEHAVLIIMGSSELSSGMWSLLIGHWFIDIILILAIKVVVLKRNWLIIRCIATNCVYFIIWKSINLLHTTWNKLSPHIPKPSFLRLCSFIYFHLIHAHYIICKPLVTIHIFDVSLLLSICSYSAISFNWDGASLIWPAQTIT